MLVCTGPTKSLFCLDDGGWDEIHRYLWKEELGTCALQLLIPVDFGQNTHSLCLESLVTGGMGSAVVLWN